MVLYFEINTICFEIKNYLQEFTHSKYFLLNFEKNNVISVTLRKTNIITITNATVIIIVIPPSPNNTTNYYYISKICIIRYFLRFNEAFIKFKILLLPLIFGNNKISYFEVILIRFLKVEYTFSGYRQVLTKYFQVRNLIQTSKSSKIKIISILLALYVCCVYKTCLLNIQLFISE